MKNRTFIIFLISLVLVISGCTSLPPQISNLNIPSLGQKEKTITESKGLELRFKEGQPPLDEIYAGQNFKVSLEITNSALQDISGLIELSDTPSDEFGSLKGKEQQSFSLLSAEQIENKIIPAKETVTFGPYQYDTSKVFPGMSTSFITEIKTSHIDLVTAQICIKSDSSQEIRCPNKETITNFGKSSQLSPVKITKIEKTIIPEENSLNLNLKIYIKNTGKGKIDNDDQLLNSFNINLKTSSNLACSKTSKISLKEGERVIICTSELSIGDELFRQEILEISFDYPYKIIETIGPIKVSKFEV